MKIDGGCHCGTLTYEAEVDPDGVFICHCTDCQKISGSAFRTVVPAPEETFRFLTGEPKIYIKTGDSGAERPQAFCPNCGSPIYATSVGEGPKVLGIRLGTVRQRDQLRPKAHYWYRSAQDWIMDLGSMRQIEKE
jgi:hypothetical protein